MTQIIRRFLATHANIRLAAVLFLLLLGINMALNPARFAPANWGVVLGMAAPLMLASLAVTIPFLAGRGSIDISVGPMMGLINVILVKWLFIDASVTSPAIVLPAALLLGIAAGALNGFLAAVLRIQPIVATLGTYLVFGGLTLTVLPSPAGSVPGWLSALSNQWSFLPIGCAALFWLGLKRLPYYEMLMATGSDDRAAYTSGINVTLIRFMAYVLAGLFAAVASLALTALIGSGDPNIGPGYTIIAIAAVSLGGVSLAGGVGGLAAAFLGAADIFLLQTALNALNVSTFVLQATYGCVLVLAVSLNSDKLRQFFSKTARQA